MTPGQSLPRFRIEKVTLVHESEGPDYFTHGEFRVTDARTNQVVAAFPWSIEEPYLTNACSAGPDTVEISDDGTEAIARTGSLESRVLLPVDWTQSVLDGVTVWPRTDYAALARDIALHDGPVEARTGLREPGGQWLKKLYERLGTTPQSASLDAAISTLLSAPKPHVRAEALRFYEYRPDVPGYERLLDLFEHQRALFSTAEKGWGTATTLDDDATRVLAGRLMHWGPHERTLVLARHEAVSPGGRREPLLHALVACDPDWVGAHAVEIALVSERRCQALLSALYRQNPDRLPDVAVRIVRAGVASRDDLLAFARAEFRGYGLGVIEHALRT